MLSQGHHANTTVHILFRDTLVLMEYNQVKALIELTLLFLLPIELDVTATFGRSIYVDFIRVVLKIVKNGRLPMIDLVAID